MKLPHRKSKFWPVLSVICLGAGLIFLAPWIFAAWMIGGIWLYERPQPFEQKVQLRGAAVYAKGTQMQSADGDYHESKYDLEFQKTNGPREFVTHIERSGIGLHELPLGKTAWFGFGDGIYLRVGDTIYSRHKDQSVWQEHRSHDGQNWWFIENVNAKNGRISYVFSEGKRRFRRVYGLPQERKQPWKLNQTKSPIQ